MLELFIEEILYFEIGFSIINPFTDVEILEPFFPFVWVAFRKSQIEVLFIWGARVHKSDFMPQ